MVDNVDYRKVIKELFRLLDSKGMSDNGKEYYVYKIGCVHIGGEIKLERVLKKLKRLVEEDINSEQRLGE